MEVQMISSVNSMSSNLYWLTQSMTRPEPKNVFSKMDENQDGSLDKTELKTFAEDLSKKTGQTVDEDTLLSILDTNKDGIISEEEFNAGREKIQSQYGFPNPGDIFKKLDSNQDGSLDTTEAQAFASELSKKTGKTVDGETLITTLDSNKDGVISEDEFKNGREDVEKLFGLPSAPPPPTQASNSNDLLSTLLMNATGSDTSGNSTESTTTYQNLTNLLLNSYVASNASLLGKSNTLSLSA
jgi:Ca2+-binding EF-hand superfamily protein